MWGRIKKCRKQKPCKLRLLISTKGEENIIELETAFKSKIMEIETVEIKECLYLLIKKGQRQGFQN